MSNSCFYNELIIEGSEDAEIEGIFCFDLSLGRKLRKKMLDLGYNLPLVFIKDSKIFDVKYGLSLLYFDIFYNTIIEYNGKITNIKSLFNFESFNI